MSFQQPFQQDQYQLQQQFIHQTQTLVASTILQIDQLSDTIVSQLASQIQKRIVGDFITQISDSQDIDHVKDQEKMQRSIQQTLNNIIQVKFHLTLLLQFYLLYKNKNEAIKNIKEDIKKFRKSVLLMESQLSMILWIQQNKKKNHFKEKYHEKFNELQQFAIEVQNLQDGFINMKMVIQALQTVKQIFHQYINSIIQLKQLIQKQKNSKYLIRGLNRLIVINAKILTISEVIPFCCKVPKDDLFSFSFQHPRWQKLVSECIVYRAFADKQFQKICNFYKQKKLNLVNAIMGVFNTTRKLPLLNFRSWFQVARSSKYIIKLILFKDAAKRQAQYMISSANTQLMKQVWNLPQHKIFRDFAELILPSIQHSQRLYIPRILKNYFNSNGQQQLPETKINFLNQYGNQMFTKKQYSKSLRIRINSKYKLSQKFRIIDSKTKKLSQGSGLIVKNIQNIVLRFGSFCGYRTKYIPQKLIFHIHGGGFVSMSSFIHQIYTRVWAKQLQIPIISVDYGKAPQHPYPQSLYDCLEAYIWTLNCYQQLYEAKPKHIIFLGDSAGGNLAASLINLCIAWKLRIPDGLVMCYPVLSVTTKKYTKSLLGTLQDMILPHTLLKLCENSYSKNKQNQFDPLISPLYTPIQFLQKYPETRIFVGSKDPFHDDCCRFTERMNQINPGKCFLTIFEQFPHAFLQFDIKTHPHQYARKANQQICQSIKLMFDKQL